MAAKNDFSKDIQFLFEMGSIRFIPRMWQRFLNGNFANLAEHHFRMFWIAMTIAAHEGSVDTGKIAKMVMVHDISESRAGDVDYLARQYVERHEALGLQDMLAGTALQKEFQELWDEYEARETMEAKIAKDADNLDVDFELAEQASHGFPLQAHWKDMRDFVAKEKLYTTTAKEMFVALEKANPHDWHMQGRNRHAAGDWQKSPAAS